MSEVVYPYLIDRVKAYFIDWIVLITLMILAARLFSIIENPTPSLRIYTLIGIFTLYEPILLSLFGGTIGHFMIGLRVRNQENLNRNISILAGFIRLMLKSLLGWLSFLTVSANEQKRAIHDFATGSLVIKK